MIVPTETVYGLAADLRSDGAVERLYRAKGRSDGKPIARLAASVEQVRAQGAVLSAAAERLAAAFWPGPLTLVLGTPCGDAGFRVPDYRVTLDLLARMGTVLAATSANRSGEPDALTAEDAVRAVGGDAALVLDAGRSPGGVPSTVVRVDEDRVTILRPGAIAEESVRKTAGVLT